MAAPAIEPIRPPHQKNRAAIAFVHGFTGSGLGTWRDLAPRIVNDPRLASWDGWTVTYGTSWLPDISGIWSADASLDILAGRLATDLGMGTLERYDALVLVAHSMGGLVVQKALVDNPGIAERTRVVILFGTPSGGLAKARSLRFWKCQLAAMSLGSSFITELRAAWNQKFAADAPFDFLAVAGEKDSCRRPRPSSRFQPSNARSFWATTSR